MDTGSNYGGGNKFHPIKTIKNTIKGIAGLIRHHSDMEYKKQRDANNLANDQAKRDLQYDKMDHQKDLAQQKHVDDLMKNQTRVNQQELDKYKADQDYDIKNKQAKNDRYKTQAGYKANVNNIKSSDYQAELNHGFTGKKKEGGKGVKPQYDESGQINFDYSDFDKQPEQTPQPDEGHPTIHPTPEPDNSDLKPEPQPQAQEQKQPEPVKENPTKDTPQPEPTLNAQETPKKSGIIAKIGNYLKQPKDLRSKFKKIASNLKDKLTVTGRMSNVLNPSQHDLQKGFSDDDINDIYEAHEKHRQERGEANLKQAEEDLHQKLAEEKLNKELDEKIARNEEKQKAEASKSTPSDIDIGYNYPQDIEVQPEKDDKPSDIDIAYDDRTHPATIGVGKNITADGKSVPRMMRVGYKQPKETSPKDIKLQVDKGDGDQEISYRKSDEPPKRLQTPKQQSDTADSKKHVANQIMEHGTQDDKLNLQIHRQKKATPPPQEEKQPQPTPQPEPEPTKNEVTPPEPTGDTYTDTTNVMAYMRKKYGDGWDKNPDLMNEANQLVDDIYQKRKDKKQ